MNEDEVEELENKASEDVEEIYEAALSSMTAQSFSDLATPPKDEMIDNISQLTSALRWIVYNIGADSSITPEQKKSKIVQAIADFGTISNEALNSTPDTPENPLLQAIKSFVKARKFKTEGGKKYYASDFAYVPDPNKPSTWKLRLADGGSGNVTVAQLGRAAAAFSSGGFRGNKVQLPSGAVSSAKKKIRAAYAKLGVKKDEIPDSVKENSSIMFFKDKGGAYRWVATYSNCYRDQDNPPEIISEASHERFVEMVDNKEAPYPELWHWHIPGSRWGVADFVAFDKENGIAVASGTIDPGHEAEAEALSQKKEGSILVSHGMPVATIKRDPDDPTVIVEHVTKEISDLPSWAAANVLTGFHIVTEDQEMGLPDAKKEYLKSLGLSDETVGMIESGNASKAKVALELGMERKENDAVETPAATAPPEAKTTPTEETTPPASPETEGKEKPVSDVVTKEEMKVFSDTLASTMGDLLKAMSAIGEKLNTLETQVQEVQEKSKTIETQNWSPSAFQSALLQRMSAVGSPEASIRKDAGLTKGPEQTQPEDKVGIKTGLGILDDSISSILSGR